jgi:hypothetical protein
MMTMQGLCVTLFGGLLAASVNTSALARDFEWMNKDQISAVTSLTAGYAGGIRCDRRFDPTVASAFLTKTFGSRAFSAKEVAQIREMIINIIDQPVIVGGPVEQGECARVRRLFGPGGSAIPGLLN